VAPEFSVEGLLLFFHRFVAVLLAVLLFGKHGTRSWATATSRPLVQEFFYCQIVESWAILLLSSRLNF
jgi:hypothetical protein